MCLAHLVKTRPGSLCALALLVKTGLVHFVLALLVKTQTGSLCAIALLVKTGLVLFVLARDVPVIHPVPGKCRITHYSVLTGPGKIMGLSNKKNFFYFLLP